MSDWIEIEELSVACRVGVYAEEYEREQCLLFSLRLGLSLEAFARAQAPRQAGLKPTAIEQAAKVPPSIDYTCVIEQLQFIATARHWGLLESLAFALTNWLLLPVWPEGDYAEVERVKLRIAKPNACAGTALPAIVVERDKAWHRSAKQELADGVTRELVVSSPDICISRLQLAPGASFLLPRGSTALACRRPIQGGGYAEGKAHRALAGETLSPTSRSQAWLLVSADKLREA